MNRRVFLKSLAAFGLAACSREAALPFAELEVAGNAGDLGLAHGKTFERIIHHNLDFYLRWLSLGGRISSQRLLEHARGFVPVLETHFPEMLEEIDGIATGAGLRLEEVLLINARTDIRAMVQAELTPPVPGCTAIALTGRVNGKPHLSLSQNWDWHTDMANAPVVLRLRPTSQPDLIALVEAGMVGKIGFNEHRLGVCLNFLSHTSDGRPGEVGVPIHCLLRAAIGCSSLEEVSETMNTVPRCASANFLLAHHGPDGPQALDLEISPDAVASLNGRGGVLVHTNHFVDPSLAAGCTSGRGRSTMARYATAQRLATELEPTLSDPVRRAQEILQSRDGQPFCISRQRIPGIASATLAGIVMDLTRNRFILARGAPHGNAWRGLPGI
jgi:isopenicillin-N N-acyltransferase-like protein